MILVGDVWLRRGRKDSIIKAMESCKQYMRIGMPVLLFPEGTRSPDGTMRAFKDGAFRLAIEEQADVLPLALTGTERALRKGSMLGAAAEAVLTVGEPISTKGMTMEDVPVLRETVRGIIAGMVAKLEGADAHSKKTD